MAVLRLVPAAGAPIQVDKDQAIVGREPACDVFVNDGSVSRRHARLERRAAAWFVVDQGSANGTYLDSQRVSDALLRPGQELRFGAVAFKVELLGDVPSAEGTMMAPAGGLGYPAPPAPPRPMAPPPAPTPPLPAPPQWGAPPPAPGPPQWPGAPPAPPRPVAPAPPAPLAPPRPAPGPPAPLPAPRAAAPPAPPGSTDTAPYEAGVPARRPRSSRSGAPASAVDVPPPGKQGRGALFWIGTGCGGCLAVVLLLGAVAGGCIYMAAKGPRNALVAHLDSLKAGNLDAAYDVLSDPYKQAVSRPAFAAFVARHPALKEYGDFSYRSYNTSGSHALISGYVNSAKGERETASYALEQEGGRWKISGIEIAADHPEAQMVQGPGGLRMDPVEVNKTAAGDTIEIRLSTNVAGFEVRPEAGQFGIDLAVDVETIGPDGARIDALSRDDVQHFRRTTSLEKGAVAPILLPLTLDRSLPEGAYTVRLRVRDRVGGGAVAQEARFTLP